MALRTGHARAPGAQELIPSCGSPHNRDGLRLVGSWAQRQLLLKDEAQKLKTEWGGMYGRLGVVMQGVQGGSARR